MQICAVWMSSSVASSRNARTRICGVKNGADKFRVGLLAVPDSIHPVQGEDKSPASRGVILAPGPIFRWSSSLSQESYASETLHASSHVQYE